MTRIRCTNCNAELENTTGKTVCCKCSNKTCLCGDKITALDLGKVVLLRKEEKINNKKNYLSNIDLLWQQERKNRKIKRLEFEIR